MTGCAPHSCVPRPGTPGRGQGEGRFAFTGGASPLCPALPPAYRGERVAGASTAPDRSAPHQRHAARRYPHHPHYRGLSHRRLFQARAERVRFRGRRTVDTDHWSRRDARRARRSHTNVGRFLACAATRHAACGPGGDRSATPDLEWGGALGRDAMRCGGRVGGGVTTLARTPECATSTAKGIIGVCIACGVVSGMCWAIGGTGAFADGTGACARARAGGGRRRGKRRRDLMDRGLGMTNRSREGRRRAVVGRQAAAWRRRRETPRGRRRAGFGTEWSGMTEL